MAEERYHQLEVSPTGSGDAPTISPPTQIDGFGDARLTEAHQLFLHRMRQQREARKTRSVHTVSSSNANARPRIRSPEVFAQREALRRAAQDELDELQLQQQHPSRNGGQRQREPEPQLLQPQSMETENKAGGDSQLQQPRRASAVECEPSTSQSQFQSQPLSISSSIHGSMEDLHRPKNFRSVPVFASVSSDVSRRRQSEPAPPTTASSPTTATKPTPPAPILNNLNLSISEISVSSITSASAQSLAERDDAEEEESDEDNTDVASVSGISTTVSLSSCISQADYGSTTSYDPHELERLRLPVQRFLAAGLRAQSTKVTQREAELYNYRLRNAVRHVSNSLLLNSRRSHRAEMLRVCGDTAQLKLQESNLILQLRVTRHVQANEREKGAEYDLELQELKGQIATIQRNEKRTLYEIRSTEEELQTTRTEGATFHTEKMNLKRDVDDAMERRAALENLVEAEKKLRDENANICSNLERQICELQTKIKDLNRQITQWEERANEHEVHGLQMKQRLDSQEKEYAELKRLYEIEHEKMLRLANDISVNEETLESIEDQLEFSMHEHDLEKEELQSITTELQLQDGTLRNLKESCVRLRNEMDVMKRELHIFQLEEKRRRRVILNGLRFWKFVMDFFLWGPEIACTSFSMDIYSRAFSYK